MRDNRFPYWGVCDVDGCDAQNCNQGCCWRETGYWHVCLAHAAMFRDGKPQPAMKAGAIARESTRDQKTGCLPNTEVQTP